LIIELAASDDLKDPDGAFGFGIRNFVGLRQYDLRKEPGIPVQLLVELAE
jgi:hypothetical protein